MPKGQQFHWTMVVYVTVNDLMDRLPYWAGSIILAIVSVPTYIYLTGLTLSLWCVMADYRERSVRQIIREMPRRPRWLILAMLENLVDGDQLRRRGKSFGRRYQICQQRPRRRKLSERVAEMMNPEPQGTTVWAH